MKFTYGKKDWMTFERGEENCWLMTNGLGGFSSLSVLGSCSRNDQAVLMACVQPPNHRYNMIHRLEEWLEFGPACSAGERETGGGSVSANGCTPADGCVTADGCTMAGGCAPADGPAPADGCVTADGCTLTAGRVPTDGRTPADGCARGKRFALSSQAFQPPGVREEGFVHQTLFTYEDHPQWRYLIGGVEVVRMAALMQGENTVGITWRIENRSDRPVTLEVLPHLQFVPKGARLSREQVFSARIWSDDSQDASSGRIDSNGLCLHFHTNGTAEAVPKRFCETLYYADDVRDGKMALGRSAVTHRLRYTVAAGACGTLEAVYGMEESLPSMEEILQSVRSFRAAWAARAGYTEPVAQALSLAASQFISERASTGKPTILAGFPFFEDWGRDTMIALVGCCLSTRQYALAEGILETFMAYCRKGLMPNLFPEGGQEPGYNTADAALLFILAVYEYYRRTKNMAFVKEAWPVMEDIVDWYRKGTDFGIRMDEDGLITAGQGLDQVTWMDVRVENILPTPRHGKPVEINAYWYNALRIMALFAEAGAADEADVHEKAEAAGEAVMPEKTEAAIEGAVFGEAGVKAAVQQSFGGCGQPDRVQAADYGALADRVKARFAALFWNEKTGCLRDVIASDGNAGAQDQIRCNQIWAVSLPFSLLSPEQERKVTETVFRRLYTPCGLRSLDPADPQFHPFYGGAQLDRDLAYHQGTVWTFPLGGYYLAYLKVNGYSEAAKSRVREQMEALLPALYEGCAGQLAEIYDGGEPMVSKGCFAQAWSVGELLRVCEALEENGERHVSELCI